MEYFIFYHPSPGSFCFINALQYTGKKIYSLACKGIENNDIKIFKLSNPQPCSPSCSHTKYWADHVLGNHSSSSD